MHGKTEFKFLFTLNFKHKILTKLTAMPLQTFKSLNNIKTHMALQNDASWDMKYLSVPSLFLKKK